MSNHAPLVFRANGKLLLTAEYAVLDGALALALPTQKGQTLHIQHNSDPNDANFYWASNDEKGNCWLKTAINPQNFEVIGDLSPEISTLQQILSMAIALNARFGLAMQGKTALSALEFPRDWGLGSSSTLISLVAQWANIDPYALAAQTFGGSGYDIACATTRQPLLYQLINNDNNAKESTLANDKMISPCNYMPPFAEQLYFVHLGRKQNSRQGIRHYQQLPQDLRLQTAAQITQITQAILQCTNLSDFERLLRQHETLIAQCLQLPTAQSLYFADYAGVVKSLGAWGGDFVLATAPIAYTATQVFSYFQAKGFATIVPYKAMVAAE